jgi:hypothetical protein
MGEVWIAIVALLIAAVATASLLVLWWNDYQRVAYRRQLVIAEQLKAEQAIQRVMQQTLTHMFAEARDTAAVQDVARPLADD